MNSIKKLFLMTVMAIIVVLLSGIASAQTINAATEDFVIKNGVLTSYKGEAEDVIIPASVTSIGHFAFSDCANLKSVSIPDSVISIGRGAFYNCQNLSNISIPNSVTSIGSNAFSHCKSLTKIFLPSSISVIESSTFSRCSNLTDVIIPDSVTTIKNDSFFSCSKLDNITIPSSVISIDAAFRGCPWLEKKQKESPMVIINGNLIDGALCNGKVVIPDTVTRISGTAFQGNHNITSAVIPDSVTYIGSNAFDTCTNLVSVKMGKSVSDLGSQVFNRCYKLKNITLSSSLTTIPEGSFELCKTLTQITIPFSVKKIEPAFYACHSLRNIILSGNVKSIDPSAFSGCPKDLILNGIKNSYVWSYAQKYNLKFKEIAINPVRLTLCTGKSTTLKLNSISNLNWTSSKPSIATVNKSGKVTTKKKGTATITVTLYGKRYSCIVIVK